MLVIRQAQFEVFQKQPRLSFERDMAAYLKSHFPFEAANADLDRWVSTGLDRAAAYGFLTYNDSAQFLALMAILGSGFDDDLQIPWAAELLASAHETPVDRISHVFDKAIEYLDAITGPRSAWFVRATLRLKRQDMTVLNRVHPKALASRIRELLVQMYPQKASVIGERGLTQLIKSAIERTKEHGHGSAQAALIHAAHIYYIGSDFQRDPCYPWAGETLSDDSAGSVDERYARMHQLTLDYFDRSFQFAG